MKDVAGSVAKAYQAFLHSCEEIGIPWIQFDEPALVQDMDQAISLFQKLYDAILSEKRNCHVLLQTYFGDVRDVYQELLTMPFDGIGLILLREKDRFLD